MPFINIKTTGRSLGPDDIQRLQSETTQLMADVMGKKAEVTSVLVETLPPAAWSIGARPLAQTGGVTAHVDIKITQGTNTAAEKAAMLAAAYRMLQGVLPDLGEAVYVVIDEIPATDWGFGGLSQDARKSRAAA